MLQYTKNIALLFVLSGVLAGVVAEQFRMLKHTESVYFNKTDSESQDKSETKKFGEDDKFQPETIAFAQRDDRNAMNSRYSRNHPTDIPGSADYFAILTPPPERN